MNNIVSQKLCTKSSHFHGSAQSSSLELKISRRAFSQLQYLVVSLLLALCAFHYIYTDNYGEDIISKFSNVFDVGREGSIPTVFSSLNLLISSLLLCAIYFDSKRRGQRIANYWLYLCIIFAVLSIDEVAQFHERFHGIQEYTGVLIPVIETHSWLLYGAVSALVLFLFFVPFLLQLDHHTAALFLLSGGIFITGALGFEFIGAWMLHHEIATRENLIYSIRRIFEEGGEMYGIALFNSTLFKHLVNNRVSLTFMGNP